MGRIHALRTSPEGFSATIADDGEVPAELVAAPWSDEVELDADGEALLRDLRVVWIAGQRPGQTTVHFSAAGRTLDLPLTVVE